MRKKPFSALMCLMLLSAGVFPPLPAAAAPEAAFTQSFAGLKAGGTLPDGFTAAGTVTPGNGYIELSAGSALLLPANVTGESFTYQVQFTIASASEPTRWAGFMFRYRNASQYMQMCVRQGADAQAGVDCAYNNEGAWQYPENGKGEFTESIEPQKVYTAKIVANGKDIALYIDGTLCVVTKAPLAEEGLFGVQANGSVVRVYGISISAPESVPVPADLTGGIKTLYEAETGIVSAPTVIQKITDEAGLNALNTSGARTQAAWFTLMDDLSVHLQGKNYPVSEILAHCGTGVLPVLVAETEATATAFARYALENKIIDVVLASSNTTALYKAWEINKLSLRYAYLAGEITADNTPRVIARNTHTANATIAIIQQNGEASRENAEYLQLRGISVWLEKGGLSDEGQVYAAVNCGANGVVVSDYSVPYQFYEKVTKPTPIRRAFIVGHRGMPSAAPENSLESYKEAVAAGADALECDVQITADGVLVSNHNGSVDGYTTEAAKGAFSRYTWEELSKYTLKPVGKYKQSQFCKMEWYFQVLKENPKIVGYVELKNSSEEVVKKTVALMEAMGVEDQVFFICFDNRGLKFAKQYAPYTGTGLLLSGSYSTEKGPEGNLLSMMQGIGLTAAAPDYSGATYTRDLTAIGRHRGIIFQTWTINSQADLNKYAYMGVDCLTTDYATFSQHKLLNAYRENSAESLFGPLASVPSPAPTLTPTAVNTPATPTGLIIALSGLALAALGAGAAFVLVKKKGS